MNNYLSQTGHLPPDLQETVNTIINGILELASRVNSNSDSNSLGGILIHHPHDLAKCEVKIACFATSFEQSG